MKIVSNLATANTVRSSQVKHQTATRFSGENESKAVTIAKKLATKPVTWFVAGGATAFKLSFTAGLIMSAIGGALYLKNKFLGNK